MVLRRKLLVNLALIAVILAVGLFMESRQSGEGFLKMTIICAVGLLVYWLLLLKTVVLGQYQVVEGTAVEVEHSGIGRKSSWEVELVNDNGERKWFCLQIKIFRKPKTVLKKMRPADFWVSYFLRKLSDPTWYASLRGVSGTVTFIIRDRIEKSMTE